jgi:CRP-like cAMP-binding protein
MNMKGFEPSHPSVECSVEQAQTHPPATQHSEAAIFRAVLAGSLIFSHLPASERDWLLAGGAVQRLKADQIVFRSGDPATQVFCVLEGSVVVETAGTGVVLNRLRPGEMFGEIGVIEGGSRTATVRAAEPCALLAIDQSDFLGLLVSYPALGFRLVAALARRLHQLTDVVGSWCETGVKARSV